MHPESGSADRPGRARKRHRSEEVVALRAALGVMLVLTVLLILVFQFAEAATRSAGFGSGQEHASVDPRP
jgi:hypothetical protein